MQQDVITPAEIGEYLSLDQCSRFYQHHINGIEHSENHDSDEYGESFTPLNLLLSEMGNEFERTIKTDFEAAVPEHIDLTTDDDETAEGDENDGPEFDPDHTTITNTIQRCISTTPNENPESDAIILYQPTLTGSIGVWDIGGHADFVIMWPTDSGVEVRVIDAKSSAEERSYQQVQAATYTRLIEQIVDNHPEINNEEVEYSAGVIIRESTYQPVTPDVIPSFDYKSRIADITRQLGAGADIETTASDDLETAPHQIDSKCSQCPYNESCVTEAFEESHIRLLGLTESEQETLANHGITSLDELAELCQTPKPENNEWTPVKEKQAAFVSQDSPYNDLKSQPGIGEQLPDLIYRAQAIQQQLNTPDKYQSAHWIPGTGRCQLPDDNPPAEFNADFEANSMIRVYLNIQVDHLRDRLIQLAARVSVSDPAISSIRISELSEAAPGDPDEAAEVEKSLLENFVDKVNTAIERVASAMEIDGDSGQQHPLLQFYTYTPSENDELVEALNRHTSEPIDAFIDTLEGPAGVDTPRVAHLKPELEPRIAIPTPSYGLLHVYDSVWPPNDVYTKPKSVDGWGYDPDHRESETVDIRDLFQQRLFNREVAWKQSNKRIEVIPDEWPDGPGLKTRYRDAARIPIGYHWAALDRIDEQWIDDIETDISESPRIQSDINSYRYHDARVQKYEITPADVVELGKHMADMLEHVERALKYRDYTITTQKQEVDPATLREDTHTTATVAEAAKDYLAIEHTTQQQEYYELYEKLPRQRILSGESLPVEINSIDESGGGDLSILVHGELLYDNTNLFDENSDQAALVCKVKGKENTSGGDWMVANRFYPSQTSRASLQPYEIEKGINTTIHNIDLQAGEVTFELRNMPWGPGKYDTNHHSYTFNQQKAIDSDEHIHIDPGNRLILDPATTSFSADRADKALEVADQNPLHTLLERLRWGDKDALRGTLFPPDQLDAFANWVSDTITPETFPNSRQDEFITLTEQVGLLQGPPGTGKTAGTLAPALCARMFAAGQTGRSLSGLVTAPSNTAIDELLEDAADLVDTLSDQGVHGFTDENIELVRITGEPPSDPVDGVSYLHYNNDSDTTALSAIQETIESSGEGVLPPGSTTTTDGGTATNTGQATIGAFDDNDHQSSVVDEGPPASEQTHTLVFATPTSSWGLLKNFASGSDPEDIANQSLWDIVVADEASMLTLPKLILAGTAMKSSGQLLLGGDHRQLPPVQKHEWGDERRRSVTEAAAYLSTLDYFRLLRGDYIGDNNGSSTDNDPDILDSEQRDLLAASPDPEVNPIPLVQLNTTFRFGPETADFIGNTVYAKDGIDYSATDHDTIPQLHQADTEPIETVYAPAPITVITYDAEEEYQQVNPIEERIVKTLLWNHSHKATAGVVTPHNAQRTRLLDSLYAYQQAAENPTINLDGETQVETVNRFQGGEKDIMIVSATASDPNFIRSESDFLLELTRANVAFSRHKYKLVVIMSESLLSHIPDDPDTYDEALLWKSISQATGEAPIVNEDPVWGDTLAAFLAPLDPPNPERAATTDISVYHLSSNE